MTETVDQAQAQPPRTLAGIIGGRLCASGRTRPQSGRTAAARSMAVVIICPVWMWLSAAGPFAPGQHRTRTGTRHRPSQASGRPFAGLRQRGNCARAGEHPAQPLPASGAGWTLCVAVWVHHQRVPGARQRRNADMPRANADEEAGAAGSRRGPAPRAWQHRGPSGSGGRDRRGPRSGRGAALPGALRRRSHRPGVPRPGRDHRTSAHEGQEGPGERLSSPANRYPPHLLRPMRAHAAGRAWRRFQCSSFSLAGYWGSGLSVITGRRHLQAA